jgi:hypothetical protein
MRFEPELIRRGKEFTEPLPDYAADAFARLVAALSATDGREVTEPEVQRLRDDALESVAALVAAEREVGTDSSRLVPISAMVDWVQEIQAALEADAN